MILRVFCFTLLLISALAGAASGSREDSIQAKISKQSLIDTRANLAKSEQFAYQRKSQTREALALVDPSAIPVVGASIVDMTFFGHPAMLSSIEPNALLRSPSDNPMLAISTGQAAGTSPAPGTSFGNSGDTPDEARLFLTLEPQRGRSLLFITWNLFSAEIPAFSRLGFDDVLSVHVVDSSGRRKLIEIASSDERMYPVSNTRAAGSGFDLYADDPSILPADYGLGKPAAWMSGWRTTGFSIDSSGPIELEIILRDGLDGLMDTQALIEQIRFSALIPPALARDDQIPEGTDDCVSFERYCNALFPQQGTFTGTGNPQAPPRICEFGVDGRETNLNLFEPNEFRGSVIQSVVADGVTRSWFAPILDQPRDEVEISLVDAEVPADGGLGEIGSFDRLDTITVPLVQFGQNSWFGQAQFYAPESYFRQGLDLPSDYGPMREVQLQFCFQNSGGVDRICRGVSFGIVRPNVVLMHGLWSGSDAWKMPLGSEVSIDRVTKGDYRASNASSFAENRYEPQKPMFDLCVSNFSRNIIGAQVDYAGHSMGGNLARVYLAQAAPYNTIHRLFTLNTPHFGSPLANVLVNARDSLPPIRRFLLLLAADRIGKPINRGAIDDLAVGSDALLAIPDTQALSHALVGIGGTQWAADTLRNAPGLVGDIYRVLDFLTGPGDLFEGVQHDLVVGRNSQIGGLPLGTFTSFEGLDSLHTRVTESDKYSERLFCPINAPDTFNCVVGNEGDLLNVTGTGEFAFFPSSRSARPSPPALSRHTKTVSGSGELIEDGLAITSPVDGQIVVGGNSITVTVESVTPFEAGRVMLLSEFNVSVLEQSPFEFELIVPDDHVGALSLSAIGEDAFGNFGTTESVVAIAEAPATLMGISISPDEVFLNGFDDRRNLQVTGQYDDEIARDISDPSTGTVYTSADPAIVSVTSDGVLRPRSDGVTTIIASNGSLQSSISVEVLNIGDLLFRDSFEP